jgi:hypothetical protein
VDDPNPIASLALLTLMTIAGLSIVMFLGITFTGPPIG